MDEILSQSEESSSPEELIVFEDVISENHPQFPFPTTGDDVSNDADNQEEKGQGKTCRSRMVLVVLLIASLLGAFAGLSFKLVQIQQDKNQASASESSLENDRANKHVNKKTTLPPTMAPSSDLPTTLRVATVSPTAAKTSSVTMGQAPTTMTPTSSHLAETKKATFSPSTASASAPPKTTFWPSLSPFILATQPMTTSPTTLRPSALPTTLRPYSANSTDEPSTTLKPSLSPTTHHQPSRAPINRLPSFQTTTGPTTDSTTFWPTTGSHTTLPPLSFPTYRTTTTTTTTTTTLQPTHLPSTTQPTMNPTQITTTNAPTESPTTYATSKPTVEQIQTTTFYAIGDVPYNARQSQDLVLQMDTIPASADFVIHVGDIRSARNQSNTCKLSEYEAVKSILSLSPVPVFIVPGDNEWNDCPNPRQGIRYWYQTFYGLEAKHWPSNTFSISRHPLHNETFSFVHKRTLFIGLNIVGGSVLNISEWTTRLTEQADWTIGLIRSHSLPTVIFGHANPRVEHNSFFDPLTVFIRDQWNNRLPILYLNGDQHSWDFDSAFFGQPNWHRIMLTGGSEEPPVKIQVNSAPTIRDASRTFVYDRQL